MVVSYRTMSTLAVNFKKGTKIGLFKGTFDLLHGDHIRIIQEIKKYCDVLFVEVKSDVDVKAKKGDSRPVFNQEERAFLVDNIKGVDFVIVATETDKKMLDILPNKKYSESDKAKLTRDGFIIDILRPSMIFTSSEKPVPKIITDFCKVLNVEIKVVPMGNGMHTTDIINKCKTL